MKDCSHIYSMDELYAQFGRTAEMAQVMELEAGNLALSYVMIAFDVDNLSKEQKLFLKSLSDDIDRRTFGNLVNLMKKSMNVDRTFEDIIDSALEKRNYLTHRFFRTHNFAINSIEGREKMFKELSDIREFFSTAHTVLHGMTYTLNELFGKPNIDDEQAKMLIEECRHVDI